MKKYLLFFALIALTSLSYAAVEISQAIITDCGTVHQIPDSATAEEACMLLDSWSKKDCAGNKERKG